MRQLLTLLTVSFFGHLVQAQITTGLARDGRIEWSKVLYDDAAYLAPIATGPDHYFTLGVGKGRSFSTDHVITKYDLVSHQPLWKVTFPNGVMYRGKNCHFRQAVAVNGGVHLMYVTFDEARQNQSLIQFYIDQNGGETELKELITAEAGRIFPEAFDIHIDTEAGRISVCATNVPSRETALRKVRFSEFDLSFTPMTSQTYITSFKTGESEMMAAIIRDGIACALIRKLNNRSDREEYFVLNQTSGSEEITEQKLHTEGLYLGHAKSERIGNATVFVSNYSINQDYHSSGTAFIRLTDNAPEFHSLPYPEENKVDLNLDSEGQIRANFRVMDILPQEDGSVIAVMEDTKEPEPLYLTVDPEFTLDLEKEVDDVMVQKIAPDGSLIWTRALLKEYSNIYDNWSGYFLYQSDFHLYFFFNDEVYNNEYWEGKADYPDALEDMKNAVFAYMTVSLEDGSISYKVVDDYADYEMRYVRPRSCLPLQSESGDGLFFIREENEEYSIGILHID